LVLAVVVNAANLQDRDGGKLVLTKLVGMLSEWVQALGGWVLEIVTRSDDVHTRAVLPRRWIGERTCAWPGKYRRLSKDDEAKTETGETLIYLAMTHVMVRRLCGTSVPNQASYPSHTVS
jgi:putative transposase